jgi:predicted Zn-dependent peptidase
VSADLQQFAQLSFFQVQVDVTPGVDADKVGKRLDAIIADLIRTGPSADEVQRTATRHVAQQIAGLEEVGGFSGKATTLAEGALYAGDPALYKKQLAVYAATTPDEVRQALQKWITRPVYALSVVPGPRDAYEEAASSKGGPTFAPSYYRAPGSEAAQTAAAAIAAPKAGVDRSKLPDVGPVTDFDFPDVSRATLSNGIALVYAHRDAVPVTQVVFSFDAGIAADPRDKLGVQSLMLALLDEGTTTLDSIQLAEAQERLGAMIGAGATVDRTKVNLFALSANLAPSLDLLADVVRNPAFAPAEVERLRGQQLARIANEMTSPGGLAQRTLPPLLFGAGHPYGKAFTGTGDPAVVAKLSRDDLIAFQRAWLRPDKAMIFVVSDRPLAEIREALDARFGNWQGQGPAGVKNFDVAVPATTARIVLVDRPDSPQSLIYAGQITPLSGDDDLLPVQTANRVLGDDFLSRLNMDLRETKAWSYGVRGALNRLEHTVPYLVQAPVQADKTGAAIAALRDNIAGFLSTKGITPAERDRTINGSVRELASSFESASDVLNAMQSNVLYKRSDDYFDTIAQRYLALTASDMDKAARAAIDPSRLLWVVVGDAKIVKPQLDTLGLPVEVLSAQAAR